MRAYLDHNATTPLRPEAREAMIAAMDVSGNPSSVHAEGRKAKSLLEKARADVATAFGADGADVIFTSSATEAAALAMEGQGFAGSLVEHDAVRAWIESELPTHTDGVVTVGDPANATLQLANSETGIIQKLPQGLALCDATQAFGKLPIAFNWLGCEMAIVSAHKLGGPKGIGALIVKRGTDIQARLKGGGQEMGRRAGTENVIGAAGFAAAAKAAVRDLESGIWNEVKRLRDLLETTLAEAAPDTIFVGQSSDRLPNTSCLAVPGWKGETQVMQMDLAGYAISAGSACSSGKVKASAVLTAMGYDAAVASSAIRVSLGPDTREEQVLGFAAKWLSQLEKHRAKAA
ncbi:cysteine desulfurase family protein [Cognatishimia activa]|uniref:cysteine desulfurase family protein n=1 Tax=Cognatishimia activa TaxID=1715691 RepID=UPI002231FCB3|nr:cysteine desulfurase family protein [Cognatishimia activa]UZD92140.1 cysteine desulfurase [Cognatishimia activa]